jgi:hypothetical protein
MPVTINGTTGITTPNLINGSSLNFRNKIINGNFDIWQRGTSLTSGTSLRFLADRFRNNATGSTYTASQQSFSNGQTDVPNNPNYFHRTVVTSVAGNANYVAFQQPVEGVQTLAGQTATLSFYAKADSNKSITADFVQYFGTGGSPSSSVEGIGNQKLNLTSSWQKFTITANIPSIAGKTLGTNNDHTLQVVFLYEAGSDYNSRTNSLGQQSGTFDIAQVQLEAGSVATPFELRPIGTELALCQRYYEKSYNIDVAPGTLLTTGSIFGVSATIGGPYVFCSYKVVKRLNQSTITIYSPNTGTINRIVRSSDTTDQIATVSNNASSGFSAGNASTTNNGIAYHFTADAEL